MNQELLDWLSIYFIDVVQSQIIIKIKITTGINSVYKRKRNTIKSLKSK